MGQGISLNEIFQSIDEVFKKDPQNAKAMILKGMTLYILISLGIGLLQESDYQQAEKTFDYYLNTHKQIKNKLYFNAYYLKCLSLYKQQVYDQVLENIKQLENSDNYHGSPEVYRLKGDSLFQKSQYNDAQLAYDQALDQRDDSYSYFYYINIGDAIMFASENKNRFKSAIKKYDKVLEKTEWQLDQDCINTALLHKGYALFQDGQLDNAIDQFQKIIQNDPNRTSAYYYLIKCLENQNKHDQAKDLLNKAQQRGLQINDETTSKLSVISALKSDNVLDIQLPFQ